MGDLTKSFLDTGLLQDCTGCEACLNVCPKNAISMYEDIEGFRYPVIDESLCINCNLCRKVCPEVHDVDFHDKPEYAFGGSIKDECVLSQSTSGGAFSAIINAVCGPESVVFGAVADGLTVYHRYVEGNDDYSKFRKSKYSQSSIGYSYRDVLDFLDNGRQVVFSGTPCQIAGLKAFLKNREHENLLTIEVVCEGVPSPLFVRKLSKYLSKRQGSDLTDLDYRYKDGRKWDFEVMHARFTDGSTWKKDRWFNPYWKLWLSHLMSRPSCYECKYAKSERCADITLGDLWGVHLYCPELYARNAGASLMVANTEKGKLAMNKAEKYMNGHELEFAQALKYQAPMRKHIDDNPDRKLFMADLESSMSYEELIKKWYRKPSLKLLWQKYVWGNRQKVALWNWKNRLK